MGAENGVQPGDWPTIASAAILGVALVVGFLQVREAARLREEQTRPFVTIDYTFESVIIMLALSNVGKTIARNVKLRFDPALISTIEVDPPIADLKLFAEGIPTMPPGKVITTVYDSFPQRTAAGLPEIHEVTITYEGPTGARYEDRVVLDIGTYRGLSRIERRGLHDIHKQLEKIATELHHWRAGSGSGLLVVTPEEVKRQHEEFENSRRRRREQPTSEDAE